MVLGTQASVTASWDGTVLFLEIKRQAPARRWGEP